MKKIETNYGNKQAMQSLEIGIRKTATGKVYGHVRFPATVNRPTDSNFRTRILEGTELDKLKVFINTTEKHVVKNNFNFTNQDGESQWYKFDPTAPSI